jgi:hypothetical protein
MKQSAVSFEWRSGDDTPLWPGESAGPEHERSSVSSLLAGEDRLLKRLARVILLALAGLITVSGPGFNADAVAQRRLQQTIQQVLQQEQEAWLRNDALGYSQMLDKAIRREWRSEWFTPWGIDPQARHSLGVVLINARPLEDRVLVRTVGFNPGIEWWLAVPYHQSRFYRQDDAGWLRTAPPVTAWGPQQSLATPHLHFTFYQADAPTVFALAERLERAHAALYQLLDQPPSSRPMQITLAAIPDQLHEFSDPIQPLMLASPQLTRVPIGISEADYLAHLVVNQMATQAIRQTLADLDRGRLYRRRALLWAVHGWLRAAVLEQRSPWQQQATVVFQQLNKGYGPLRLTDIADRYSSQTPPREEFMWEYMAAESVVTYTIATYGVERLPLLVRGLGEFSYWGGLVERVYGLSTAEFERRWNEYLTTHYPPLSDEPETSHHAPQPQSLGQRN